MKLIIRESGFAELHAEEPRSVRIRGVISMLLGISLCFVSLFVAILVHWIIGVVVVIVAIIIAYMGMIWSMRSYEIVIFPSQNLLELNVHWRKYPSTHERFWDTTFLAGIEARQVQTSNHANQIGIFLTFKNGEEEQVMTDFSSIMPQNCMKNVNQILQNKKVRKGTYRD